MYVCMNENAVAQLVWITRMGMTEYTHFCLQI